MLVGVADFRGRVLHLDQLELPDHPSDADIGLALATQHYRYIDYTRRLVERFVFMQKRVVMLIPRELVREQLSTKD